MSTDRPTPRHAPRAAATGAVRVRVLVVDDDPADVRLVTTLLRDVEVPRHEVVHATSFEALRGLVRDGLDVDVVLLDPTMRAPSGAAALHAAVGLLGDVPIVVHATPDERAVAVEALAAGAEDHLVKGHATGWDVARVLGNARERHCGRRALADALARVERASADLLRMRRAQDEFVAIASHELRTPVTVASGFVRLLAAREGELSPSQRADLLARTAAAMARLEALADDLLAVSRAGHGRIDPMTAAVDLRAVVEEAVVGSSLDVRDAVVDVPSGLAVVADRLQLVRVVRNLVDNGVRHGRPPVVLRAARRGTDVELSVLDHGDGVPEHFVPAMFDRFTQADPSTSRPADGTGLGLSIVRDLVEAVGGRVHHVRAPTGGACFTVSLAPAVALPGAPPRTGGGVGAPRGQPGRRRPADAPPDGGG